MFGETADIAERTGAQADALLCAEQREKFPYPGFVYVASNRAASMVMFTSHGGELVGGGLANRLLKGSVRRTPRESSVTRRAML